MRDSTGRIVRAYATTIGVGLVLGTLAMVMTLTTGYLIRLVF